MFCWEKSLFKTALVRARHTRAWAEPGHAPVSGDEVVLWTVSWRGEPVVVLPGCAGHDRLAWLPATPRVKAAAPSEVEAGRLGAMKFKKTNTGGKPWDRVIFLFFLFFFKADAVLYCNSGQLSYSWRIWSLTPRFVLLLLGRFLPTVSNVAVILERGAVFSCMFLCEMWKNGSSVAFPVPSFIIGFCIWRLKNRTGLCTAFLVLFSGWSWADPGHLLPSGFHLR